MRRLTKAEKLLLLDLAYGSRTTTARWRDYVPLSNLGLVDVDTSEAATWSRMWGVTCATVALTDAGRALVPSLDSDVSLWHAVANAHAASNPKRRCICGVCMAAWRMRPVAA